MGEVLTQLFEITALFEMRLRPELVLLQKTMMTVEGVARRIYPDHDIWSAAEPVVRRWIARELSPVTRLRNLAGEAETVLRNLARLAANPVEEVEAVLKAPLKGVAALWFTLGAAAAAAGFLAWMWLR